ncbi:MAG TPA: hypothetical protein VFB28_12970 [Terriglobales bacterium]|nr:hypothetical protein [Terriglobales bacterium]
MPREAKLSEQQILLGVLVLRTLLEKADEFIWQWHRPEDFKDVLTAEISGLRIELVHYTSTAMGRVFLRYGGDTCGVMVTETAPENGRQMFFDAWEKTSLVCKRQRDDAIRRAFGLNEKEAIGFKFSSDQPPK